MKAENLFGEVMRRRPGRYDGEVIALAATLLANRLREEFASDFQENVADATLVEQLRDVLEGNHGADGYALAKELDDRFGWEVTADLVAALNGGCIDDAYYRLLKKWVEDEGLKPGLAVGATVRVKPRVVRDGKVIEEEVVGEIVDIDCKRAVYTVCCPSLGHVKPPATGRSGVILTWEEVEK